MNPAQAPSTPSPIQPAAAAPPSGPLARLDLLELNPIHQALLEQARGTAIGPAALRQRILADARELLALAQVSGRLNIHWIDLAHGLRAKLEMQVPVPCRPQPSGPVQTAPSALLGVMYPPEALMLPQPGFAFVRILAPHPVWSPNVSPDANQALCLGPRLPPGFPLREILLMTYGALSFQITQFNRFDPAGLMNAASADWWQAHTHLIPLTREPFIRPEVPHVT